MLLNKQTICVLFWVEEAQAILTCGHCHPSFKILNDFFLERVS